MWCISKPTRQQRQRNKRRVAALIIFALLGQLPTVASNKSTFSPQQQEQIGNIVREYLLAHPEILDQLARKWQAQQMQRENDQVSALTRRVITQREALLENSSAPHTGPDGATVMVMAFYDYRCLPCGKMDAVIAQMMHDFPQVRFVFFDWPMAGAGWSVSETASAIAVALWQQQGDAVWQQYHLTLFSMAQQQGKVEVEDIARVVKAMHIAVPEKQAITQARRVLSRSALLARRLQLSNLPTVIVMPVQGATMHNTSVFIRAVSASEFQAAIVRGLRGGK